jgi:peptide/nickel transport system substrate-binding protein
VGALKRFSLPWMLLSALLAGGCQQQPVPAGELRVGLAQLPITLDPRFATDAASHRVQEFVHRGLVRLDAQFRPQPDLASSWSHPDPLTWIFHLRSGISFHDGTPVTAADVAATLKAVMNPALASPLKAGFAAIRQVTAAADGTVRIELARIDTSLLTRLSVGILPASVANQKQMAHSIVGCGPFRVVGWEGNRLRIERVAGAEQGRVRDILFIGVKDPVTRILKLSRGEIDFIQNDLPWLLLPYLQGKKGITVRKRPSTTFSYLGFNLQDPVLKDVRVRRALALALDRNQLKRTLLADTPQLAETVLPPNHWATARLPLTPYDPEKARRLLDAAGLVPDKSGIRLHLTYRTSTNPERLQLATAICDAWRRIGVDVSIESLEWGGFYARIKRGDFQLFSLQWVGIVDPDIYRWILHSDMWPPKGANRGRYSNPQVDRWLEAAAGDEDMARRKALYAKIERQMQQDQVYIPLWYEAVVAAYGPRLRDFELRADGSLRDLMQAEIKP